MSEEILFKDKITTNEHNENIYTQLAKNMAKAIDIEIAKTPLVDLLTTYTNYLTLTQENQQLKINCNIGNENLNFYREEYKKYKSVLDEIREFIDNSTMLIYTKNPPRQLIGTDKLKEILDKVKE